MTTSILIEVHLPTHLVNYSFTSLTISMGVRCPLHQFNLSVVHYRGLHKKRKISTQPWSIDAISCNLWFFRYFGGHSFYSILKDIVRINIRKCTHLSFLGWCFFILFVCSSHLLHVHLLAVIHYFEEPIPRSIIKLNAVPFWSMDHLFFHHFICSNCRKWRWGSIWIPSIVSNLFFEEEGRNQLMERCNHLYSDCIYCSWWHSCKCLEH